MGRRVVYTSDTGHTHSLAAFARDADLFMMECSFWRSKPVATHLELADAMSLAQDSGARRVVLAHLYPEWDGVDIAAEAKKLWDGESSTHPIPATPTRSPPSRAMPIYS